MFLVGLDLVLRPTGRVLRSDGKTDPNSAIIARAIVMDRVNFILPPYCIGCGGATEIAGGLLAESVPATAWSAKIFISAIPAMRKPVFWLSSVRFAVSGLSASVKTSCRLLCWATPPIVLLISWLTDQLNFVRIVAADSHSLRFPDGLPFFALLRLPLA